MGDYNKDSKQDKFMDFLLQELPGCSDEELLEEFEAACNLDIPLPNPDPSPEQFEKIWSRIQAERADLADSEETEESVESGHGKVIKVRFGWKRLAAVGLIACLMAGSGCIVAMGTKSYFFRERTEGLLGRNVVLNNDSNKVAVNGEEEAYALIEIKLGIKPMKLNYLPYEMEFYDMQIGDGVAYIEFDYNDDLVYFMQSKYEKRASYNPNTDLKSEEENGIYNKWLRKDIKVRKEIHIKGETTFEASVIVDGAYYRLVGAVEEATFYKIVEELSF